MDKLKKIPESVWLIILVVALCLRDLYGNLTFDMLGYLQLIGWDTTGLTQNILTLSIVAEVLFGAVIYAFLFELVARFFYAVQLRRGNIKVSRRDYLFELRYFFVLACLVCALLSLIYLAIPDYVAYVDAPIQFAVVSVTLSVFYFITAKRFVPHGRMAKNYLLLWGIYYGFYFVVDAVRLVVFLSDMADVSSVIASGVLLGNCLFVALIALIPLYFLRQGDKSPEDTVVEVISPDDKNDETFIGLGF